jgi:tetratricopeptide (TPR) repeat protein
MNGRYEQAINSLTDCLQLDAQFVSAYYNRSNALSKMGDEAGAFADYNRGLQLEASEQGEPHLNDEHGYYARGVARLRSGNRAGAISDLHEAARICQQHQNLTFQQVVTATLNQVQV